jgi:hypothetical protein
MTEKSGSELLQERRVFLDTDSLTQWDHHIGQRFPQAEKTPIYGLEPGPAGSWDEAATTIWGSVIKENGLLRMWYWGLRAPQSHKEQVDLPMTCYAESEDGIHWRKPDLKITGQHRYPGNNLLTLPGAMMSVVPALPGTNAKYLAVTIMYAIPLEKDVQDVPGMPDPLKGGGGTHIWASDDGLHWRHLAHVMTHGDWACLYPDRATNRYILHNKCGAMHGMTARRIAIGLESRDGKHWEGYGGVRRWRETFSADDFDDLLAQQRGFLHAETYGAGMYRAGETLVSVESIFNVGPPLREMFAQNPAGLCHVRLGFSHDGFKWRYPKGRPTFMELGAPGELDAGFVVPSSTLVEHNDELLFYYGGSRYDHDWSINPDFTTNATIPLSEHRDQCRVMLAKIKRDRFASLSAVWQGRFDVDADRRFGDDLFVNVQAQNGQVRVALAEKDGPYHGALRKHEHLPGFAFEDCVPITGDHVRAPVRFRNAALERIPRDLPLTVRFELNRAEVFAYEWA